MTVAACGDETETNTVDARTTETPPSLEQAPRLPNLLTEESGDRMEAIIAGVLGQSDAGCFSVGDAVIVAPAGSTVLDDRTVKLEGMGEFAIGDKIRGGGGYLESLQRDQVPPRLLPCFPAEGLGKYVQVYGL